MGALVVVLDDYQLNQKGNQLNNFQISSPDEEYVEDRFECNIALSYEICPGLFETLVVRAEELRADGIVNADAIYWVASAHAVMGETERALEALEEAVTRGWRHAWWTRHDWNWVGFEGNSRYRGLLARGAVGVPSSS